MAAFSSKGYHGCTTRDIAAAAGMSPAALYAYFETKEELLYLISNEEHELSLRQVRDGAASSTDPVQRLEAMVRQFVVNHAERHLTCRISNYELGALSPEHFKVIAEMRTATEDQFRDVLDAGLEIGAFNTTSVHMTARALVSLMIDTSRWFRDDGAWTPEDLACHYVDLALKMVEAQSSTHRPQLPESEVGNNIEKILAVPESDDDHAETQVRARLAVASATEMLTAVQRQLAEAQRQLADAQKP